MASIVIYIFNVTCIKTDNTCILFVNTGIHYMETNARIEFWGDRGAWASFFLHHLLKIPTSSFTSPCFCKMLQNIVSILISIFDSGSSNPVLSPGRGHIVLCSWARYFTPTVPLSTQVYEWVLAI